MTGGVKSKFLHMILSCVLLYLQVYCPSCNCTLGGRGVKVTVSRLADARCYTVASATVTPSVDLSLSRR